MNRHDREAVGIDFSIQPAQVLRHHKTLNWALINESLFVVPCNDGEAKRACQILRAINAPHLHVSKQGWGATLDKERSHLTAKLAPEVKRIVLFEMPGQAVRMGEAMLAEEDLRAQGYELVVIDHHHYRWVDRYQALSSLEQLCALIAWPLGDTDLMIAVNDRSFIPGLKKMGLSTEQILAVRTYDLQAQGYNRPYIEAQRQAAQREIERLAAIRQGALWVIDKTQVEKVFLVQELALQSPDGLVNLFERGDHKMSFSGSPAVVDQLMALDYSSFALEPGYVYYGGGDGSGSKYWGFRLATRQKKLPPAFDEAVAAILQRVL